MSIIYPEVNVGTVINVTDDEITFRADKSHTSLTIRTGKFIFDEFTTGDKIWFSFALSKKPFSTSLPAEQSDYNDWYDPDTHPDIVD